jgi:hypothetical protein
MHGIGGAMGFTAGSRRTEAGDAIVMVSVSEPSGLRPGDADAERAMSFSVARSFAAAQDDKAGGLLRGRIGGDSA